MEKIILHSDLNNYFASVECLLNPSLRNKPVVVGGSEEDRHGIVLAKNQQAKEHGIKTAETLWQARQKCPTLIVVPPQYRQYAKYSKLVKEIYEHYTDRVEPFGIDECWLDVSGCTHLFGDGQEIAHQIKEEIKNKLGLTVSIGVSFSKILAKLGSETGAPDSVTYISRENFKEKTWQMATGHMMGVGWRTERKLASYGIHTIGDIARSNPRALRNWLGSIHGEHLWEYANGLENTPVCSVDYSSSPKSLSHGVTCFADLQNEYEVTQVIYELSQEISHRLRLNNLAAKTIYLYVRDNEFGHYSYQCRLLRPTQSFKEITTHVMSLFKSKYDWKKEIRSLIVGTADFVKTPAAVQLDLFSDYYAHRRTERVEIAVEKIRDKYGQNAIFLASSMNGLKMRMYDKNKVHTLPKPIHR